MTAPTPQQMRALEEDASDALQESIVNGNRIRMTIPADPKRDADLRIAAALTALRIAADRLEAVQRVAEQYAGWHEDCPEDSWRFERDIRSALGMEQYSGSDDD